MTENSFISKDWNEDVTPIRYLASLEIAPVEVAVRILDESSAIIGQFATVHRINENEYEFCRDPLGIAKLFYTEDSSGQIHYSHRFTDLFIFGSEIYSIPAGSIVRIGAQNKREKIGQILQPKSRKIETVNDLEYYHAVFNNRMKQVFSSILQKEEEGWTIFIALSGGLDSSIIASYASRYLKHPVACTIDLGKSEDSEQSVKIAKQLKLDHRVFATSYEEIIELLDEAPFACQDFRDFNVHCAVLNMLLAKNIREFARQIPDFNSNKMIVLTGDLMNEFTCDYSGEIIEGKEYYTLPKVTKKVLQEYLIDGLDTSDRELSPFAMYGLHCIQPFSSVIDLFRSVDERILERPDAKKFLNSAFVDPEILQLIPKTKLRAQVGDRDSMGILGISHRLGLNNRYFRNSLLQKARTPKGLIPIFVGRYDVEVFK